MISNNDIALIKMITSHYYIKRDRIVNKIEHGGRMFFNKFEKINEMLSPSIMKEHAEGKIVVAHSLISDKNIVENIVFDYNGTQTERFYHRAQLLLREEGYINFTAYKSKTNGHLHLYIHKGHTTLEEAYQLGTKLSAQLAQKLPIQWKVFPTMELPREFNILALPYEVYQKERGASWSKHM